MNEVACENVQCKGYFKIRPSNKSKRHYCCGACYHVARKGISRDNGLTGKKHFPESRTSLENGITLSKRAHREFHNRYGWRNDNRKQLAEFLNEKQEAKNE